MDAVPLFQHPQSFQFLELGTSAKFAELGIRNLHHFSRTTLRYKGIRGKNFLAKANNEVRSCLSAQRLAYNLDAIFKHASVVYS